MQIPRNQTVKQICVIHNLFSFANETAQKQAFNLCFDFWFMLNCSTILEQHILIQR